MIQTLVNLCHMLMISYKTFLKDIEQTALEKEREREKDRNWRNCKNFNRCKDKKLKLFSQQSCFKVASLYL